MKTQSFLKNKYTLFFIFCGINLFAQQDSQYTQYMYNTGNINPAYTGSRGVMSVFGLYRTQWVGLDGAPKTATAAISTPIENSNVALGLSFVSDKIGPADESSISADFSYTVPTSENFKLSFGLKATANLLNVDYTKLNIYNPSDPNFQNNIDNRFSPNIGAGIYWHSDKSYIGLSVPNFLETKHFDNQDESVAREKMHYYLIGGYVFDINPSLKFKPSFLAKAVNGAPLQVDASANFLFNEKFTIGVAYRWSAAVSAMAGFQITDGLFVGYAYDAETTRLSRYNSGSHEIFLRFELFNRYNKITSPRFF